MDIEKAGHFRLSIFYLFFYLFSFFIETESMGKPQNTPDVDDYSAPPPAYQETPPFNPNFPQQGSSTTFQSPPFNPNYNNNQHHHSPPHTPDINQQHQQQGQTLYPQIPISPPPTQTQHVYQPQQHQARYQTIELPYPSTTPNVTDRMRRRQIEERRKFPLAAIFFLFGWYVFYINISEKIC